MRSRTVGLGRDALMRPDRVQGPKTRTHLREMVGVLNRDEQHPGPALIACARYRSEPLAGFGGLKPMQPVQDGPPPAASRGTMSQGERVIRGAAGTAPGVTIFG